YAVTVVGRTMSANGHEELPTSPAGAAALAETLPPPANEDDFRTLSHSPAPMPTAAQTEPPPPEPDFIGRYRILRVLGKGGMGKVYEAHDTKLERTVALKIMLPQALSQPGARERFLREARTMAAVHNDHVVAVFDVDEAGDTPY